MRTLIIALALSAVVGTQQTVYDGKEAGVKLPVVTKSVKAEYTQEAIDAHIEGFVVPPAVSRALKLPGATSGPPPPNPPPSPSPPLAGPPA